MKAASIWRKKELKNYKLLLLWSLSMNDREAMELLESMVRIRSLSGEERGIAAFLVQVMRAHDFDRAFIDEAGNAIGVITPHNVAVESVRTMVLLGHMDTVPGDIPVRIENEKLYGRGAVDAKGPLACFVAAAARLAREGAPLRIVVIGCVEEESPTSKGARFAVGQHRPDFCIVGEPSGWNGVTLGYKGYVQARLRLEQGSAHTAHPTPTVADLACRTWMVIREAAERFNAGRDRIFDHVMPVLTGVNSGGDGRRDWAELRLGVRLPPDLPPDGAENWLRECAPEWRLEATGGVPAWSGPRTTPLHRALARAIRAQGGEPIFKVKTGTADLNIVAPAWGCPTLAYGPGDAALDHTPDEHIELPEYLRSVEILTAAIRSCAA
jgi:LysW-gamma-L-lysine carboxypeptidase